MASSKYYAYYIRGRQLALVQHDYTLGSGQTLSQPGLNSVGARGDVLWKSPTEDVTNGLEIEYAYSPRYTLEGAGTEGTDLHKFLGWGSNGTNLLLFTYGASAVVDLSSLFAADDYIVISGSGRWNGLHQVKSTGGATGILTLKTKCNLKPSTISFAGTFAASTSSTSATIDGHDTTDDKDMNEFGKPVSYRSVPYIFILNAENTANNGMFSVSFDTDSGQFTVDNKITISAAGAYTSSDEGIVTRSEDTINIYNTFYEQISVYEGVNVLSDEADEIDLPEYLAKALVYYVKAKIAEDRGELEQKEYNMREFKRLLERNESSKIWGARRIGTDETAIK
jgi:hypothetical protein